MSDISMLVQMAKATAAKYATGVSACSVPVDLSFESAEVSPLYVGDWKAIPAEARTLIEIAQMIIEDEEILGVKELAEHADGLLEAHYERAWEEHERLIAWARATCPEIRATCPEIEEALEDDPVAAGVIISEAYDAAMDVLQTAFRTVRPPEIHLDQASVAGLDYSAHLPAAEPVAEKDRDDPAPVVSSDTKQVSNEALKPAETFTFVSTSKGCTVTLKDGTALFVNAGKLRQLGEMLDNALERFIGDPWVRDYLSVGRHRHKMLAAAKRPRNLEADQVMTLVRSGYVEIGTAVECLTLTHDAGRDLGKRLRLDVKARDDKRENAKQRRQEREHAEHMARVAAYQVQSAIRH